MTAARSGQEQGYVLLLALVTTAIGLAAAFAALALAEAVGRIAAADAGAERAVSAARAGVVDAADRLAWGGLAELWQGAAQGSFRTGVGDSEVSRVTVRRSSTASASPVFEIESRGTSGSAVATERATLVVKPLGLPRGITVAGDLRAGASFTVAGSGVYVGGDVWGRELVTCCAAGGKTSDPGSDHARPELWSRAAVHADGRIYAEGVEVHLAGSTSNDTDACSGVSSGREAWPPDAETRALLMAHTATRTLRVSDTAVDLAALAVRAAAIRSVEPQSGVVLVLRPRGGSVAVSGWWPQEDTPQVTLVVVGDAAIVEGAAGAGASLHGALLVTGTLTVDTPALIVGFLAAGALDTREPLSLVLPAGWEDQPPPGSLVAVRSTVSGDAGSGAPAAAVDGSQERHVQRRRRRSSPAWRVCRASMPAACVRLNARADPGVQTSGRCGLTRALPEMNTMVTALMRESGGLFGRIRKNSGPKSKANLQSCRRRRWRDEERSTWGV